MALHNDPRLFSGGIVEFDTTPTVNAYRQIEAERRAKNDAIDDYMKGLRSKVTPAGMRVADLPAFDKMRRDWQNFGILNREKMSRDPQLRSQFESMGQDLLSFAEESKAEESAKKPFVEMMTDPNKRAKLRPEVFGMVSEHDKPLYTTDQKGNLVRDYSRKKLDYTSNLFKEPEFDFQKEYKGWVGEMKPGEMVELDKPVTDKQTGLVYYPAKEKFNKEQIAQVGRNAVRSIADDEDKLDYYANRLASIGQKEYQDLDNIYKKYFNDNIGKSPEKLAAAEAALAAEQFVGKETMKSKLDYERRQEDKRINISLNQGGGSGSKQQPIEGNEFDRIPPPKGGWFNPKKMVQKEDVPERVFAILKSAGIDLKDVKYFTSDFKDGKHESLTPVIEYDDGTIKKLGKITRQDMFDAQLKYNAEPQKGQQPTFGQQPTRLPKDIQKTKMSKKDPLGLGL